MTQEEKAAEIAALIDDPDAEPKTAAGVVIAGDLATFTEVVPRVDGKPLFRSTTFAAHLLDATDIEIGDWYRRHCATRGPRRQFF